jgi:hypothetical protein
LITSDGRGAGVTEIAGDGGRAGAKEFEGEGARAGAEVIAGEGALSGGGGSGFVAEPIGGSFSGVAADESGVRLATLSMERPVPPLRGSARTILSAESPIEVLWIGFAGSETQALGLWTLAGEILMAGEEDFPERSTVGAGFSSGRAVCFGFGSFPGGFGFPAGRNRSSWGFACPLLRRSI